MRLPNAVRDADGHLTQRAASRIAPPLGQLLSTVRESAESSRLWCGSAAALAAFGGRRGRRSAVSGLAALALAQVISNAVGKHVVDRPRPSTEWIEDAEAEDRPGPSSFPSVHTAAAVAFASAITPSHPPAGALGAVSAVLLAVEQVQSGAHYPTDVAAGALIGLGSAWLILQLRAPESTP
ncbi:phosphatase PAP2 family protein [Streptomyces aureus]|uniref:phosphatase PAP2 family protein n=1 Tax=Streptomyces aureus TaxID=193461 RepID=UPI0033EAE498